MTRFVYTCATAAVLWATYWVYHLLAVPAIEPQLAAPWGRTNLGPLDHGPDPVMVLRQRLRKWFPEQAWEVKEASKILDTPQGVLVLQNYENRPDGTVRLWPCSMVFLPEGDEPGAGQQQAVVLQAEDGAILRFSKPLELQSGSIGRLLGGKLEGRVSIRSQMKHPGPEDDLAIFTSDVEVTEDQVRSDQPVYFEFGKHQGQGRGLTIQSIPADDTLASGQQPRYRGIRSVTFDRDVQMILAVDSGLMEPSPPAPQKARQVAAGNSHPTSRTALRPLAPQTPKPPVVVTSAGPFHYEIGEGAGVATFRESVVVQRVNPTTEPEQLQCDELQLRFAIGGAQDAPGQAIAARPGTPDTNASGQGGSRIKRLSGNQADRGGRLGGRSGGASGLASSVAFEQLFARGQKVLLTLPEQQLRVECQLLRWDQTTGWLSLRAGQLPEANRNTQSVMPDQTEVPFDPLLVRVSQGTNEIRAPEAHVRYDHLAGRLGQAVTTGPGQMRSQQQGQTVWISWGERLIVRPDGPLMLVSLTGGARVSGVGQGQLQAEAIRVWLDDLNTPKGSNTDNQATPAELDRQRELAASPLGTQRMSMVPRNLEAVGQVKITSRPLTGELQRLDLWFNHLSASNQTIAEGRGVTSPPSPSGPATSGQLVHLQPGAGSGRLGSDQPSVSSGQASQNARRFHVVGHQVSARLRLRGNNIDLTHLRAEGGRSQPVRVVETTPADPAAGVLRQPMTLVGHTLQVDRPTEGTSRAWVAGNADQLARVEGQGMTLEGDAIKLDQGKNRMWVDGPGLLTLLVSQGPDGRRNLQPQPLEVRWQGGMNFDGQQAQFNTGVECRLEQRVVRTNELQVALTNRLDLSRPESLSSSSSPAGRADRTGQTSPAEGPANAPAVQRITCQGGFYLESRTLRQGLLASVERVSARNLVINQTTGRLQAAGPGWLVQVRRGKIQDPQRQQVQQNSPRNRSSSRGRSSAAGSLGDQSQLYYLRVQFEQEARGNLTQKDLRFYRRVETTYGPVGDWEDELDPDRLGPEGVWMRCDQLALRQFPRRTQGDPQTRPASDSGSSPADQLTGGFALGDGQIELEALDNVQIEGNQFTARGQRLSYTQDKDLIILEGDERLDARLWRQSRPGAPVSQLAARKIYYWRADNAVKLDDVRTGDFREDPSDRLPERFRRSSTGSPRRP